MQMISKTNRDRHMEMIFKGKGQEINEDIHWSVITWIMNNIDYLISMSVRGYILASMWTVSSWSGSRTNGQLYRCEWLAIAKLWWLFVDKWVRLSAKWQVLWGFSCMQWSNEAQPLNWPQGHGQKSWAPNPQLPVRSSICAICRTNKPYPWWPHLASYRTFLHPTRSDAIILVTDHQKCS